MDLSLHELDNGIDCLFVPDPDSPKFSLSIQFKVGSRYESKRQNGLAHLLEHMVFKGTRSIPDAKKLVYEIENLGASVNAWTSKEVTNYYISSPKDNMKEAVGLLSQMVTEPIFNEMEIKKEKQVIVQEIKMYEDDPMQKVFDLFINNLFYNHPLGRNIAGSLKSISLLDSVDCEDFIKNKYSSRNILLVASGPFEEDKLIELLEANFKYYSSKSVPLFIPFISSTKSEGVFNYKKDLKQTHIVMGSTSYSYSEFDEFKWAYWLGRAILSGGMGSILNQKIREELALAYYIDLDSNQYEDTGFYRVSFGVDPKKIDFTINEVEKVFYDFLQGKFSEEDIDRARNYLIGGFITYFETSSKLATFYAKQFYLSKRIQTPEEIISIIKRIKKNEIIDAWGNILNRNKLIITLGPR